MSRSLKLVHDCDNIIMQLYDMFDKKKYYKKLMRLVKISLTLYGIKPRFEYIQEHIVTSDVTLRIEARNYDSSIRNSTLYPVEITYRIYGPEGSTISAKGSGQFNGCTRSEATEFYNLLKSGLKDFDNKGAAYEY